MVELVNGGIEVMLPDGVEVTLIVTEVPGLVIVLEVVIVETLEAMLEDGGEVNAEVL